MAGGLCRLLLLDLRHAVCELIKLCVLWMDVIQPGVLLCDGSIIGGILIVSAMGLSQMPLSMMKKACAKRECFPFVVFLLLKAWTAVSPQFLHDAQAEKTTNRKVITQATCAPTDASIKEDVWYVGSVSGGDEQEWHLVRESGRWRPEISLCDMRLFIDTGEAETNPNGSLCLTAHLCRFMSRISSFAAG